MRIHVDVNNTLQGHKLLLLCPWRVLPEHLDHLHKRFPDLAIESRRQSWNSVLDCDDNPEQLWKDVTILVTCSALPSAEQAPRLEYVQLLTAGADPVLRKPIFKQKTITFCTANGVHGPQLSEWVVASYLALQHRFPTYWKQQSQGRWAKLEDVPDDSVGRRIGILGYGSIGRQTGRVAKALGMDVHAYTLHPRPTPESRRDKGYTPVGLGDPDGTLPSKWFSGSSTQELHNFLGSGLDLLVIATPLTEATRGLIAEAEFEILAKNKTFVSNIARGPVVNADVLIRSLNNNSIRGAALDVTDPEPLPDGHPLWTAKNVIITPHRD
ncbi:NAD(P)-binding domain protein, partial [Metarhizium brunneum ARSEF 3297]